MNISMYCHVYLNIVTITYFNMDFFSKEEQSQQIKLWSLQWAPWNTFSSRHQPLHSGGFSSPRGDYLPCGNWFPRAVSCLSSRQGATAGFHLHCRVITELGTASNWNFFIRMDGIHENSIYRRATLWIVFWNGYFPSSYYIFCIYFCFTIYNKIVSI